MIVRISRLLVGLGMLLVWVSGCSAFLFGFVVVFDAALPETRYLPWVAAVTHVVGWSLLWLVIPEDNYGLEPKHSRAVLSGACALTIAGATFVLLGLGQYGQWREYRDAPRCAPTEPTREHAAAKCSSEQTALIESIRVDTTEPIYPYGGPKSKDQLELRLADGRKQEMSVSHLPFQSYVSRVAYGSDCGYSHGSSVYDCEVPVKALLYQGRVAQLTLPGGQRVDIDQQAGRYRSVRWLGALCLLGALWPLLPLGLQLRRTGRGAAASPAAEDAPSIRAPASRRRRLVGPTARRAVLAALLSATAVVIGILVFSNEHDRGRPPPGVEGSARAGLAGLLDRVPGEAYQVAAIDMATARRRLGVPADLAPKGRPGGESGESPQRRFDRAAVTVLGYLTALGDSAATAAIDHGLVTAAVRASQLDGSGDVVMLATRQPMRQIKRRLEKAGLRPLSANVYAEVNVRAGKPLTVVGLRRGLVILGDKLADVWAALRRTRADPRLSLARGMLERTRGALGVVRTFPHPATGAACVRAIAGGELLTSGGDIQDLLVSVRGKPRGDSVKFGQSRDIRINGYRVKNVTIEGKTVVLKVRRLPGAQSYDAATIAEIEEPDLIYRCPGA